MTFASFFVNFFHFTCAQEGKIFDKKDAENARMLRDKELHDTLLLKEAKRCEKDEEKMRERVEKA